MFNRRIDNAIGNLYDSIYLLSMEVKDLREELDYLLEVFDND